jgi:gliding motility-associated-like protein
MKAAFESPDVICSSDMASFKDLSTGLISSWNWDFGNGTGSLLQFPPAQKYPLSVTEKLYDVRLIVQNSSGCSDTSVKKVKVVGNCFIAVPSAFTPNGDMLNDYLFPSNGYKADNLLFNVYNRYGQLVFQTKDWTHKWDGRVKGQVQDTGTYIWTLTYANRDTGKKYSQKGTTVLIR